MIHLNVFVVYFQKWAESVPELKGETRLVEGIKNDLDAFLKARPVVEEDKTKKHKK